MKAAEKRISPHAEDQILKNQNKESAAKTSINQQDVQSYEVTPLDLQKLKSISIFHATNLPSIWTKSQFLVKHCINTTEICIK